MKENEVNEFGQTQDQMSLAIETVNAVKALINLKTGNELMVQIILDEDTNGDEFQ